MLVYAVLRRSGSSAGLGTLLRAHRRIRQLAETASCRDLPA
jgi:hypothetical protein